MMSSSPLWLALAGSLAALDWSALWLNWPRVNCITKPGVILVLIAWVSVASGWEGPLFWFGLALVFSMIGDICLLWKGAFLGGLIAFLAAHICYIIALNPTPVPLVPASAAMIVLVWLIAMLVFRRLQAAIRKSESLALLQFPLLIYFLAVSTMLVSALATLVRPEWPNTASILVASGGVLFAFSDALLSVNRFVRRIPRGQFCVRIPYQLGQIALTLGVLMGYGYI